MSDAPTHPANADRPARKIADHVRGMRLWQKALLVLSITLMVAGVALRLLARDADAPPTMSRDVGPSAAASRQRANSTAGRTLLSDNLSLEDESPRSPPPPEAESPSLPTARDWSPALFKLGFSFFAGFCIAAALRLFFRAAAAFIGLVLLAAFALQYGGLLHINWSDVAQHGEGVLAWLRGQTATFRQFIVGQLPSAASAAAGLFVGWRHK